VLIVALAAALARDTLAAMPTPCQPSMNGAAALSEWEGHLDGRRLRCTLCASVISFPFGPYAHQASASVTGQCRVARSRRRADVRLDVPPGSSAASGTLCRTVPRRKCARRADGSIVCPQRCCTLAVPAVTFDANWLPTGLDGTFDCPRRSGEFGLSARPPS